MGAEREQQCTHMHSEHKHTHDAHARCTHKKHTHDDHKGTGPFQTLLPCWATLGKDREELEHRGYSECRVEREQRTLCRRSPHQRQSASEGRPGGSSPRWCETRDMMSSRGAVCTGRCRPIREESNSADAACHRLTETRRLGVRVPWLTSAADIPGLGAGQGRGGQGPLTI